MKLKAKTLLWIAFTIGSASSISAGFSFLLWADLAVHFKATQHYPEGGLAFSFAFYPWLFTLISGLLYTLFLATLTIHLVATRFRLQKSIALFSLTIISAIPFPTLLAMILS